jgi:hypothetical protein
MLHIADSGNVSAASSYYGGEAAPSFQEELPPSTSATTTTTTATGSMPAARPLPRANLGARSLSGGRPPRSSSAASSKKGSTNSLNDAGAGTEEAAGPPTSTPATTATVPSSAATTSTTSKKSLIEDAIAAAANAAPSAEAATKTAPPATAAAPVAPPPAKGSMGSRPPSIAASMDSEAAIPSIPASIDGDIAGDENNIEAAATTTTSTSISASLTPAEKINRLSRLVQNLKQKVQRLENENLQLEEMLAAADAAHKGGSGEISRLEDLLAKEQASRVSVEAALRGALAAKEGDVLSLKQQLDASTVRAAQLAEAVASREAEQAQYDAERSTGENQLISTLRKEIEAAEATLEEERKAHAAARRASAMREQELDSSVAEAAASLTAMQRLVEERTSKAAVAEERCRELEHEVENVGQRLAAAEARVATSLAEGTTSIIDGEIAIVSSSIAQQRVEELELTLSEVRRSLATAEAATATANEEVARLRSDTEILKRQLAEARSSDSAELRRRLQEATDALYAKQAQLERATADRAATQLQLERQMSISTSTSESLKRRTAAVDRMLTGGAGIGSEDGYGIVPMDESTLGDTYARLANAPGRLGHAVKSGANFIDSSTTQVVRVLRHYPLGRLAVFCYVVSMHLFIYLLLHRLQHRAFSHTTAVEAHDHLASAGGGVVLGGGNGSGAVNAST